MNNLGWGSMDPFYEALSLFRRQKYEECADKCSELLENNPRDQVLKIQNVLTLILKLFYDYNWQSDWEGTKVTDIHLMSNLSNS